MARNIEIVLSEERPEAAFFTSGDSTLVYKCPLENNNNKDEESVNELIEHGSIETNELNMTLMSHMTHHDSV